MIYLNDAYYCPSCGTKGHSESDPQKRDIADWPKITATFVSIFSGLFIGIMLFMAIIAGSIRYLACLDSDNQTVSCDLNSEENQFDWIISLLITAIMLIVIYIGYRRYKVIFSRVEWVEVNTILTSSKIKKKGGGEAPTWYTIKLKLRYEWQGAEHHKKIEHGDFRTKSNANNYSESLSPDQIFKLLVDPNNPNRSIVYKGIKNTELAILKFIGAFLGSYIFALIIYNSDILFFIVGIIPVLLFLKLKNYVNKEISSNKYWNQLIGLN